MSPAQSPEPDSACWDCECYIKPPFPTDNCLILVQITSASPFRGYRFDGAQLVTGDLLTLSHVGTGCPHVDDFVVAAWNGVDGWYFTSHPARLK